MKIKSLFLNAVGNKWRKKFRCFFFHYMMTCSWYKFKFGNQLLICSKLLFSQSGAGEKNVVYSKETVWNAIVHIRSLGSTRITMMLLSHRMWMFVRSIDGLYFQSGTDYILNSYQKFLNKIMSSEKTSTTQSVVENQFYILKKVLAVISVQLEAAEFESNVRPQKLFD